VVPSDEDLVQALGIPAALRHQRIKIRTTDGVRSLESPGSAHERMTIAWVVEEATSLSQAG
jgi:hypothetical protein